MDRSLNILCSICARGGSQGVKNKNIRLLGGKPLIAHSLEQAKAAKIFSEVAVSSDSDEILKTASDHGATILIKRPLELASHHSPKIPAIQNCFIQAELNSKKKFDIVVDLDCTSPLRSIDDILKCLELLQSKDCTNVLTGNVSRRNPYFNIVEIDVNNDVRLSKQLEKPVSRRQDVPQCYDLNASIYVWWRDILLQNDSLYLKGTRLYVMPPERSYDIDEEIDFLVVETLLAQGHRDLL